MQCCHPQLASPEGFHDWWYRMPLLPQVLHGAISAVSVPNPGLNPQLKGDQIICFIHATTLHHLPWKEEPADQMETAQASLSFEDH